MTPDEVAALAHDLLHARDTSGLEQIRRLYARLQPAEFDALMLQIVNYWSNDRTFSNSETTLRKMTPLVNPAVLPDLLELYRTPKRNQQIRSRLMWLLGEHPHARARLFWLAQNWSTTMPFFNQLNRLVTTLLANYPSVYEFVTDCLDHQEAPTPKLIYGGNEFRLVWDEPLRLIDASGKNHALLPTPDSYDDLVQIEHTERIWQHYQTLAYQFTLVVKAIWERAMLDEYCWTRSQFKRLFWENPLAQRLAQRVIWGVYENGVQVGMFRIGEDLLLSDLCDQPYSLPDTHIQIGVVHPIHLTEAERAAWNTLLNDYQIIPVFSQMQRSIYTIQPSDDIDLYPLQSSPFITNRVRLRSINLWRTGWEFNGDNALARHFSKHHVTTHIFVNKISGYEYEVKPARFALKQQEFSLRTVPPLVISETLYTMAQLRR